MAPDCHFEILYRQKERPWKLEIQNSEKYDDRGQIIIERGQFFKTYLYGAGYDQAHFKIMERGHLTS